MLFLTDTWKLNGNKDGAGWCFLQIVGHVVTMDGGSETCNRDRRTLQTTCYNVGR